MLCHYLTYFIRDNKCKLTKHQTSSTAQKSNWWKMQTNYQTDYLLDTKVNKDQLLFIYFVWWTAPWQNLPCVSALETKIPTYDHLKRLNFLCIQYKHPTCNLHTSRLLQALAHTDSMYSAWETLNARVPPSLRMALSCNHACRGVNTDQTLNSLFNSNHNLYGLK